MKVDNSLRKRNSGSSEAYEIMGLLSSNKMAVSNAAVFDELRKEIAMNYPSIGCHDILKLALEEADIPLHQEEFREEVQIPEGFHLPEIDILQMALIEAQVPLDVSSEDEQASAVDSLEAAAHRILRYLEEKDLKLKKQFDETKKKKNQGNEADDEPPDQDGASVGNPFAAKGNHTAKWVPPNKPKKAMVNWKLFEENFHFRQTSSFQGVSVQCGLSHSRLKRPPHKEQTPALRIAVQDLLSAGIIQPCKKGPFNSPVFLVPVFLRDKHA